MPGVILRITLKKMQTYIEPAFDLWTREKRPWNIFTTDPKGELLAKFYYPATKRNFEITQFNLMNPNLTDVFNPLINAIQEFRRDNAVKGTAIIDSIVTTLFPDNGEIWNPAAGNMFRRAVYMLFDYYIEQERYIRYLAYKNNTPQEVLDYEIDKLYSKVTMYNVYAMIGELAAKVSKDLNLINLDPDAPPAQEKDFLTLIFDATTMLPRNSLRSLAITANNAIKQIAGAQTTIAGIYATLLTGLSDYADPTTIALMSGGINTAFDVSGMGFPRRFGVQFDNTYSDRFRIKGEIAKWSVYKDKYFKKPYEGKAYTHEERISPTNWVWGHFAGIFENNTTYIKLEIESAGTIVKTFYFQFDKGYQTFDGISYYIDPITKSKRVQGGTLIELDEKTKKPKTSEFETEDISYQMKRYDKVKKPIIVSNQIFYTEKPKFVFAITPPHLQHYQKHILIIIKQIIDEIYSNSYTTKENRKPIVGTRLMLEEFGNIRSGENGIPNIDTVASIALGQDVQITFVLQSFQQLRSIYGDDVEKILRANSSNTIFLKSNDQELVDELVRLSGVTHEMRSKSKSSSRKVGDVITVSEAIINYTGELTETTALTSNDLLFLPGRSPGNSITFSSGEMPIVNKLATITPMAAGLHKRLPQPKTGQYSDNTMPTAKGDTVNYLNNTIDGEALVLARVAQAKIAKEVKEEFLAIASKNGKTINEQDGELANLMMNTVYELYEQDKGQTRTSLSQPTSYEEIAKELADLAKTAVDKSVSNDKKVIAVQNLKEHLIRLAMDKNIKDLTDIYTSKPDSNSLVGYNTNAVSAFITQLYRRYPEPQKITYDKIDIFAEAAKDHRYKEPEPVSDAAFDWLNPTHTENLQVVIEDIIEGRTNPIKGLGIEGIANQEQVGQGSYTITLGSHLLATAELLGPDLYQFHFSDKQKLLSQEIEKNKDLMSRIYSAINEDY